MNKNQLSIRLHGEPVGILEQVNGKMLFTYNKDAAIAVSIGMPIREQPYNDLRCKAFFGGLLPENEAVKKIIGKRYGINPNNNFALLRAIGYDCAGAISCHAIEEPVIPSRSVPLTGRIITEDELYQHLKELPKKPLFMDVDGLRLSLAGVYDKAAICLIDNNFAIPQDGCPTTHILKPASAHFEGITENEYFCLKMAKRLGLPVPEIELKKIKDIKFLLIERYDRVIKNSYIERVHQEDFCQALGVPSIQKYQNEGGPGFKNCFELIDNTTQPANDRNLLAKVMVFNYLINNTDAHGKNFSLLHLAQGNIRLAPCYDMICTGVYQNLSSKMAMKIGSKYDAKNVLPRHWQQLCDGVHYRYLAIVKLIEQIGNTIEQVAADETEQLKVKGIASPIIDNIINVIHKNIEQTRKKFSV